MNYKSMLPLLAVACSGVALAADSDPGAKQLQLIPKNLARHHLGSNLFLFNTASKRFEPTEAAAAWLDEDVSTGSPIMAGTQDYLLALAEPEVLTNFCLSTRPTEGTVTLFAGDEPAAPGAKSWQVIARDIPIASINDKKMARSFSKLAKYLLIETKIAQPGPMFGLYVYGEHSAASYDLRPREHAIDTREVFGKFVNTSTSVNLNGLDAHAHVEFANSPDGFKSWQSAIDDNPGSSLTVLPSTNEAGVVISLGASRTLSRVAMLTDAGAKGKLDIYALPENAAQYAKTVSVENLTPAITLLLDGSNSRSSLDFPAVQASAIAVRWTPDTAGQNLALAEIETFGSITLADAEVGLKPDVVAAFGRDYGVDPSKDGKTSLDGKDPKDPKELALGPPSQYLPGALGFPPNIDRNRLPPLSP